MIKARVIASPGLPNPHVTTDYIETFYQLICPFIYRKYRLLDDRFTAPVEGNGVQEVRRKGMRDNIKLGAGGIREVEFIAQSAQLIRGGREPELQQRNLLFVLDILQSMGQLQKDEVEGLKQRIFSYVNLNPLASLPDSQTQQLPVDDIACERLAWLMGFDDWNHCKLDLDKHRQFISNIFQAIIAERMSGE